MLACDPAKLALGPFPAVRVKRETCNANVRSRRHKTSQYLELALKILSGSNKTKGGSKGGPWSTNVLIAGAAYSGERGRSPTVRAHIDVLLLSSSVVSRLLYT